MPDTTPLAHGPSTCAHDDPASTASWRCAHDAADHGEQYCRRDRPAGKTTKPGGAPAGADARFVDPWRGC